MSKPENNVEKLKYRSKAYEKSHHHNLFLSVNLKNQKGEPGTIRTTTAPLQSHLSWAGRNQSQADGHLWHQVVEHHYAKWVCNGKRGKWKRQNGLCAVERGSSEESRAMTNGLMWMACLPSKFVVMFGPGLLPMAMSGPVGLMQLWWAVCVHGSCYHWGRWECLNSGPSLWPYQCSRDVHHRGHANLDMLVFEG